MNSKTDASPRPALGIPKPILWIALGMLAWFALSEVATEGWYRWKESQARVTQEWPIQWPTEDDAEARGFRNFKTREMGEMEQEVLRFDEGLSANWNDSQGHQWIAFSLKWKPNKRLNNTDIAHNPTICLPAVGLHLVRTLPGVDMEVDGARFPFSAWEFEKEGRKFFVYVAVRRQRDFDRITYGSERDQKRLERLKKVFAGNRGNPLESLQMIVVGVSSQKEANALLAQQLRAIVAASNS